MPIPNKNVLGNPNVTEGDFQIALESLRESVIGSGKAYDSANTYAQYDTCVSGGITYYSKVNGNIGNSPAINTYWGLKTDLLNTITKVTTTDNCIMRADGITGNFQQSGVYIDDSNNVQGNSFIVNGTGGIGFTTGSGGTVTQATSKTFPATLNKYTGRIVMNNASLAAGATVVFQVNNNLVTTADTITAVAVDNANYDVNPGWNTNGAFTIKVTNTTGGALSEALTIQFSVTKGAIA